MLEFLINAKVLEATLRLGVDGFCKSDKSTVHLEGIVTNKPMIIGVVDEMSKLDPLVSHKIWCMQPGHNNNV